MAIPGLAGIRLPSSMASCMHNKGRREIAKVKLASLHDLRDVTGVGENELGHGFVREATRLMP